MRIINILPIPTPSGMVIGERSGSAESNMVLVISLKRSNTAAQMSIELRIRNLMMT